MNHVVFHNDIDGIISASLFQCCNTTNEYRESCLYPVASTMRGSQLGKIANKLEPEEPLAVLDFEFNERASIWIDHHFNPNFGPNSVKNNRIFYDPAAKSTVSLVADKYGCPDGYEDLINMSDMIDSASYPNVNFIFESDHPLMILRAYIETAFPAEMTFCRIVEVISNYDCDVGKALRKMKIDENSVKNIRNIAKKIHKAMTIFGRCSFVHQSRQNQFPRYSEFFSIPNVEYSIRMTTSGSHHKYIQIGHNQWAGKPNKLNLGEFLRDLPYVRGGGHFNVAAGIIKNADEQKFLDDLDIHFNMKEESMEKYGVDKTDPVEDRAQELVKEGVDISDARMQSQVEMEKKSDVNDEGKFRPSGDIRKAAGDS